MHSVKITKVVRILARDEQPTDFAYWQQQPYHARLAAVEEIRQEYHRWKYDTEPGLQRVFQRVKR